MHGFWPIFFLLVVLKIPVLGSMGLVWWAIRSTPETEGAEEDTGGEPRRFQPEPRGPRNPRRGPRHGGGAARPCPTARPAAEPAWRDQRPSPPTPAAPPAATSPTDSPSNHELEITSRGLLAAAERGPTPLQQNL